MLQFFIHDEKLGTPDLNWAYYASNPLHSFMLSDDYADSFGDACYINLDLSEGLFYLPVVDSKLLDSYGIPLRFLAKQFARRKNDLSSDFLDLSFRIGLDLDVSPPSDNLPNDCSVRCMKEYFFHHPEQKIYYLFTKAQGRKGIVPIRDSQKLFSSIALNESNILSKLIRLYRQHCLIPLLAQTESNIHKKAILARSQLMTSHLSSRLKKESSLLDLEKEAFQFFSQQLSIENEISLVSSSEMHFSPFAYGISQTLFQLAVHETSPFANSYNQSLDDEKKPIQRIKPNQNYLPLPFYYLRENNGEIFRHPIALSVDSRKLYYQNQKQFTPFEPDPYYSRIIGKAMPLLNELSSSPDMMAMPEDGSKYSSACKRWTMLLREQGLAKEPIRIIRIGLNVLDNLYLADEHIITMPSFLKNAFGHQISSKEIPSQWKMIHGQAQQLLKLFNQFGHGQEILFIGKWLNKSFSSEENHWLDKLIGFETKELFKKFMSEYLYLACQRRECKEQLDSRMIRRYETIKYEYALLYYFHKKNLVQWVQGLPYLNHRPYFLPYFLFFGEKYITRWMQKVTFRTETW